MLDPLDADSVPRRNLLLLATGSQGERRAASAQLAQGKYLGFELKPGDTFLFSSKTIPGNEVGVARVLNALSEKGVTVIDDSDGHYHVCGHANRPDLVTLQELLRPRMVVPMHGEHRHLSALAALARERGIAAVIAPNGTMLDLTGDAPRVAEQIETGRVYLDGTVLIGAMDGVVRDRIRMALRGHRRGQRDHRRGRPAARRRLGRGDRAARQPEDARRAGGGARGRARPGAGAGEEGRARRRRCAGRAGAAGLRADLQRRDRQEAGGDGDDQPAGGVTGLRVKPACAFSRVPRDDHPFGKAVTNPCWKAAGIRSIRLATFLPAANPRPPF